MTSVLERAAALHIGIVESVAPDSIVVRVDTEAPQTTALNTGVPSAFPRLNGYVLVPKEAGALVGLVVWLGIDRSSLPRAARDRTRPEVIDLPFPQRRMVIAPVGTLLAGLSGEDFQMERGVVAFPSVGDEVLLPTGRQLRSIVEPGGTNARLRIGEAVLAAGAVVAVDPDRLFGRHVAVLGNTGSGKSCTVAGLIRWSLEAASAASKGKPPNARFIVLDPNGEYSAAFDGLPGGVRVFRAPPVDAEASALQVPAWLWNGHEWSAFAAASARVQRPLLMRALRDLRSATFAARSPGELAWAQLAQYLSRLVVLRSRGVQGLQEFRARQDVGGCLRMLRRDADALVPKLNETVRPAVIGVSSVAKRVGEEKWDSKKHWFGEFALSELDLVIDACRKALEILPPPPSLGVESEDAPIAFEVGRLADHLETLSQDDGMGQAATFISSLVLRVRTMLADQRMKPILEPNAPLSFEEWLKSYVGDDDASNGALAVVDLSLVPSDVVHTVVAVLARVIFEASQRYRRRYGNELPTVLVLEEAHTFIRRHDAEDADTPSPSQMCRQTFERIAREGRKFGLGLLLSSQRPSELSATVLAQCNTFLLHRLVNDRDQDLVRRLVPDNLAGLLGELPTLPTRHAIVLGWATPLPVLTRIRELPPQHRPSSSDPAFWATWIRDEERRIDWGALSRDWVSPAAESHRHDSELDPSDQEDEKM